jgi:hypothetical protein
MEFRSQSDVSPSLKCFLGPPQRQLELTRDHDSGTPSVTSSWQIQQAGQPQLQVKLTTTQ